MTQQVRTGRRMPDPIRVGGRITFQGADHTVVRIKSVPEDGHALVCRLHGMDGAHEAVLLEEIYADMARAAMVSPEPALVHGPACTHLESTGGAGQAYLGGSYEPPFGAAAAAGTAAGIAAASRRSGRDISPDSHDRPTPPGAESLPVLDAGALLEALPEAAAAQALERCEHLREAMTGFRDGVGADPAQPEPDARYDPEDKTLDERLRAKAAELGKSVRTVYRWHSSFRDAGLWGLVSGNAKRDIDPLGDLDVRVIDAVLEQADIAETHGSTGTRKRFYTQVKRRLEEAHAAEQDPPKLPSFSTMQAKIDHLVGDRRLFSDATSRRTRALSPRKTFQPLRAVRPGQTILMDATRLDVRLYEPEGNLNVSVTLTLAIDLCTRTIVAWRIVPGAENQADAVLLLADMMRPEPMRAHWRQELSHRLLGLPDDIVMDHDLRFASAAAKPVIFPETLIVDHGKVYVSDAFRHGCERLGVNLQLARTVHPTDKPYVERLFGRIRTDFSQHIAGFKGRNTANRGPLAETQARFTVPELEELFAQYVVAIYQRSPHWGLRSPLDPRQKMSPNEAFAAAVARCGWVPAPVDPFLYFQLLPIKWVKIHPWGVQINYRVYDAPVLRRYGGGPSRYTSPVSAKGRQGGRAAGQRLKGQKWPVRIDPRDVLYAYFLDPDDQQWHELPWGAGCDLEPFSETLYKHVRTTLAQRAGSNPTEDEVAQAIADLQESAGAPENWTAQTRRQLANSGERARAAARDRANAGRPARTDPDNDDLNLPTDDLLGRDPWDRDPWDRDPWDSFRSNAAGQGRHRPIKRRAVGDDEGDGLWPDPGSVTSTPLARSWTRGG